MCIAVTSRHPGTSYRGLRHQAGPLSYRITKHMPLDKERGIIEVNDPLALAGIPKDTLRMCLGHAPHWSGWWINIVVMRGPTEQDLAAG